jgi:thiamine biosynthesis protein ThiS
MSLAVVINGQIRTFAALSSPVMLAQVITEMDLKADRVAIEHNGEIAQRARWAELPVSSGDRLEVVHFVGGGTGTSMADMFATLRRPLMQHSE